MVQHWEVVGGSDKGGILVRAGQATTSEQLPQRLATGALVEQLELAAERLNFRKLSGDGPETGWVSIALKDKALLEKRDAPAAKAAAAVPSATAATASTASAAPAALAAPATEEPWSVKTGDYYVTLGVVFKKPGDDPQTQKMLKLTRKVGSIVHTTGKVWKGPTGGFWVELDISAGDSGAGEKPGYVLIDGNGFGTPGPCLQMANIEDGAPLVLKVLKPAGATAWDKMDEDKDIVVLQKTPISEVRTVIGMLFGVKTETVTVYGPSGGPLKDDSTVGDSGFDQHAKVKFESTEKALNLIVMTPVEEYEGQKLVDLPVKDSWTVGQAKELLCKLVGLEKKQMIVAKGKMGQRVSEDAHLSDGTLISAVGYKDGDEFAFIYLGGDLAVELAPFLARRK